MKKILSILLVLLTLISSFSIISYAVSLCSNNITDVKTVTDSAVLKFSKKFGSNYKGAPTPPVVVDDTLLVVSGVKLYKLDAETGEEIASVQMNGSSLYTTVSPIYADGIIFVQLDGGIVQAFDYKKMKSLWIYTDLLGGQALCPITYDNGYIYTGFWNGETDYANYVCLSTKDENTRNETEIKSAKWTYKALGGFYWAGCAVADNYVVFGKDNGKDDSTSNSKIISLSKNTGAEVSSITVKGDIRSSVSYASSTDSYYISSKSGYVYKFALNTSNGKLTLQNTYTASGSVTATPVVCNGRLYVGCQKGTAGEFVVLNASNMNKIYSSEMSGYPQATMLVSTGYESSSGKIYIYSTYNNNPGGITMFEDSIGQTSAVKKELFTPDDSMKQYCISTISAGEDGTVYYKNDSGNIFAVGNKEEKKL
ncbi:MAG: PQQ-binding-like beta-propeller repeat protein, partial [Clostridia bacterium]|nr:PQQ-binding-like beta-propeller repeat protein [Clostridia bacterium]